MRYCLLLILIALSSCAVEFKSNQFDMVKNLISGDKRLAAKLQWEIFFEGEQHTAYAVTLPDKVRFVSLNYVEIDFKHTFVSAVRTFSPSKIEYVLEPDSQGYTFKTEGVSGSLQLVCTALIQISEYIYNQQCENSEIAWNFTNQLEVNQKREVVYIKSYYSPSKPAIEMYHSPLFETLKNRPNTNNN